MPDEINKQDLLDYIEGKTLEECVGVIYSLGRSRLLFGKNSVMLRMLG